MRNKQIILIALAMILALSTGNAFAQKIAYINSQQILANFKEATDAKDRLEKINQEWEAQGRELQRQFQELGEQLESQSLLLSEDRKQEKQQELQNLYMKIQQYQQEKWGQNGEYFKKEAEVMQPVIDKINKAINKVGEEMKFDYIFDSVSANIVYASPSQQDLTEEILKELEKGLETTGK
ncbi:MAG TPA: OmpH family outer membrane protein [bacterium]|nr:OmpH family outer membrane protein [bacterium]HNT65836.1 OmpH family outer membrane protein [bacterium]HOX85658.1 OmpH family outer membrane protein [bacterium]HPG44817.1 OmpH family outer membrane protein [bacterium]HPM98154.1 OmpH family outer membrane protein [bacterium]